MGEVLLAYDPLCGRPLAIKRIRPDLAKHRALKARFLREAKITAQLTHPGIIAIYSIHQEENDLYYTMPYIEGETLKQILKKAKQPDNLPPSERRDSIPALLEIFKSVCQLVAYAHSKGVLHRDLKPENILVGKFGEVIVLDWGLAQRSVDGALHRAEGKPSDPSPEEEEGGEEALIPEDPTLTIPGKLVGTVAYMAPERALGAPSSYKTDLYALGVILYQILTLQLPFERPSIKEFCKSYSQEKLSPPEEVAPYREVPPRLSRMVQKCLEPDPEQRYQSVDALIQDLISHLEGRSEWFESARLDTKQRKHWEFQENVLISKHVAITRAPEAANWFSMMVSKHSFSNNMRLETSVKLGPRSEGIGFLLSIPESSERDNPLDGYCLWIGSSAHPVCQLFRNTVEVKQQPDLFLKPDIWNKIVIEKIDRHIHFSLNGQHQFTYLSYLPLLGTHVGILSRDEDFALAPLVIFSGSQNLQVSCLSIPDAFLANKDYKRALAEYHRISDAFPGQMEGREALFRTGITLLEQARTARTEKKTEAYYARALEAFGLLHKTAGAPLEYLGKALVYQALADPAEEIKCLELGLRRYGHHPLVHVLQEQIVYRMHEASQTDRRSAYQLILLILRLLPHAVQSNDSHRLFKQVISHWEPLPFFETVVDPSQIGKDKGNDLRFAIPLAFWLASPYILLETYRELTKIHPLDTSALGDLLFALFELGSFRMATALLDEYPALVATASPEAAAELQELAETLAPIRLSHTESLSYAVEQLLALPHASPTLRFLRTAFYLMHVALRTDQEESLFLLADALSPLPLSKEERILLDGTRIWAYLKRGEIEKAGACFDAYPFELLNQEGTLLHPLYGCYLYMTEEAEIAQIHFSGVIDTHFPRSWTLLDHERANQLSSSPWFSTSFLWERRQLYRQLALFAQCTHNLEEKAYYEQLASKEYIDVAE